MADPGGAIRPFGIPTGEGLTYSADERRVLWQANGCVLVADVGAPAAGEPGPGPCPRSELRIEIPERARQAPRMLPGRRFPVRLRCIAAMARGCVGRLRSTTAPESGTVWTRFRIAAGTRRTVYLRLSPRAAGDPRASATIAISVRIELTEARGRPTVVEGRALARR